MPASRAVAADDWRLELDRDGIQVQTRAVDGWSIRQIRGSARIAARLPSVVAVIDDPAAQDRLEERVAQATIQHRESATRYQLYARLHMPWPVSDRDIVNQRQIRQDPTSFVVTITDTALRDAAPRPGNGVVRIVRSTQVWTLTPDGDGVRAQVTLLSDPNGPLPAALINSMSISTPFKMLKALRALAQSPPYALARPAFIEDPGTR
ncbi:START domain-containing protein [Solimonas terrae]|uniref:START domain-containing protein n=1 Tax=Solimonas terrae TaxID=1396819 RepID=A0A6M2BQR1_9GAMM|nr:START domain-containing protein [Solimonas terrae]NGY04808.1 hypothetical protein [Solimonas terrae]